MLEVLARAFEAESESERPFYVSPSNLGRCGRELLLSLLGLYAFRPKGVVREILRDGVVHEDRTLDVLASAGMEIVARQAPVFIPVLHDRDFLSAGASCTECGLSSSEPSLHGHVDAVGLVADRGVIVEHKAVGEWVYRKAVETITRGAFDELYRHFREYFVQAGVYLVGLKRGEAFAVREGGLGRSLRRIEVPDPLAQLLVRNRNRPDFLSVAVEYDEETDTLVVPRAEILENGRFSVLELSGRIPRFMTAVERKLAILADFREKLSVLSEVGPDHEALASFLAEHPEVFARAEEAARRLPARTERCAWCGARQICEAVFGELARALRRERSTARRIFVVENPEERRLLERIAELEAEKKRIEREIKSLKNRALSLLVDYNAGVMVDPETGLSCQRVFKSGGVSVSASKLPSEVLDYLREVAPEAVTERTPTVYARVERLPERRLRKLLAQAAHSNDLFSEEPSEEANEVPGPGN